MAATVTKEFLYKQMQDRNMPFWVASDARDEIARNMDKNNVDDSISELEEVFAAVMDTFIYVTLYEKTKMEMGKGGNNRKNTIDYKIQLRQGAAGRMGGIGGFGNNLVDDLMQQNRELTAKLHEKSLELVRTEFNQKLEDLKSQGKSDPLVEAAIGMLTGAMGKGQQPVTLHGANDGQVDTDQVKRQQKLKAALNRLAKIDKQLDDTMTKLADFAERSPDKYHSFIPLLATQ